jgi:hypothetical protein
VSDGFSWEIRRSRFRLVVALFLLLDRQWSKLRLSLGISGLFSLLLADMDTAQFHASPFFSNVPLKKHWCAH